MGWHEWPLIVFTVLAQTAVGAFILSAIAILVSGASPQKLRFERSLVAIWVLLGAGFLASMAHLGRPMWGINAILRVGQAPLSNEIASGVSFLAVGGLAWLLSLRDAQPGLRKILYIVGMLLGVALLYNMTRFYMMPTVPTWNTPLTPLAFVTTALLGGAMLTALLSALSGFGAPRGSRLLAGLAIIGFVAAAMVTIALVASLSGVGSSIRQAGALSPDMAWLYALRFGLLTLALLFAWRMFSGRMASVPAALASLVLVAVGEMIGRGVFFALHMTVGLI